MCPEPDPTTEGGGSDGASEQGRDRSPEEDSANCRAGTSAAPVPASPESGDGSDAAGASAPAAGSVTDEGGGEEGPGNPEETRADLPFTSRPNYKISDREFELAVKAANGNQRLAARALGIDRTSVRDRIKRTPHLFALYGAQAEGTKIPVATETSTMVRTRDEIPPLVETNLRAEQLMAQDRQMLRDGLLAAGIQQGTVDRIKALDGLAKDAGSLLSASLDYTHRLHIYSTAALFEEMIYIRDHYLREEELPGMERVFWQRAFNEIADLLGKSNDRTMASTQAMVAMMRARDGGKGGARTAQKAQPGW